MSKMEKGERIRQQQKTARNRERRKSERERERERGGRRGKEKVRDRIRRTARKIENTSLGYLSEHSSKELPLDFSDVTSPNTLILAMEAPSSALRCRVLFNHLLITALRSEIVN